VFQFEAVLGQIEAEGEVKEKMDGMDRMDETEGKDSSKNGTASGARIDSTGYRPL
jgi:hypothetical protein